MDKVIPDVSCVIEASCMINPSEDPKKVALALSNVIAEEVETRKSVAVARSRSMASLERIREAIVSRQLQRTYRRNLEKNLAGTTTKLYLNKQAAFAQKIAICQDADESPLGPITITLASPDIDVVIGWLASK